MGWHFASVGRKRSFCAFSNDGWRSDGRAVILGAADTRLNTSVHAGEGQPLLAPGDARLSPWAGGVEVVVVLGCAAAAVVVVDADPPDEPQAVRTTASVPVSTNPSTARTCLPFVISILSARVH